MSDDFFRFPHTPHIEWLGKGEPRGDKLLPYHQVKEMLDTSLTVEEKVDGANVGFSLDADGKLRAQNRGAWIDRDVGGQFKHLWSWAKRHEQNLEEVLGQHLILFGEWCYARHSLAYGALPDWFIGFDIYDRNEKQFYSVEKRDEVLELLGIEMNNGYNARRCAPLGKWDAKSDSTLLTAYCKFIPAPLSIYQRFGKPILQNIRGQAHYLQCPAASH